jgi:hypothetical protein
LREAPRTLLEAMLVASSDVDGAQRSSDTEVLANVFTRRVLSQSRTSKCRRARLYSC